VREVGQALLILLICAGIALWMAWILTLGHGG
jgi:hypothetical protein